MEIFIPVSDKAFLQARGQTQKHGHEADRPLASPSLLEEGNEGKQGLERNLAHEHVRNQELQPSKSFIRELALAPKPSLPLSPGKHVAKMPHTNMRKDALGLRALLLEHLVGLFEVGRKGAAMNTPLTDGPGRNYSAHSSLDSRPQLPLLLGKFRLIGAPLVFFKTLRTLWAPLASPAQMDKQTST